MLNLLIDLSEACRTEIRRRVNHSRKAAHFHTESANISNIFNHDKCVILEFLQEEFYPFMGDFWQQAQVQNPWPTLHDWSYPGEFNVQESHTKERVHFAELIDPLYEKGFVFTFSHSGLYNAKLTLVR